MIIGVLSDLRGLAYAFNKESTFQMFFDWMYLFSTMSLKNINLVELRYLKLMPVKHMVRISRPH